MINNYIPNLLCRYWSLGDTFLGFKIMEQHKPVHHVALSGSFYGVGCTFFTVDSVTGIFSSSIPGGLVTTSARCLDPLHFDCISPFRSPSTAPWNLSFKLVLGRIQTTTPIATRAEPRQDSPIPAAALRCKPLLKLTAWVSTKNRSPSPNDSILGGVE